MNVFDLLKVMNYLIVVYFVIFIIFFYIIPTFIIRKRSNYLTKLLKKNPKQYIEELDLDIKSQRNDNKKNYLNIEKMRGYLILGEWENIETIFEDIFYKNIDINWKYMCILTYILSLFLKNDIGKANEVLNKCKESLQFSQANSIIKQRIFRIYAINDFYLKKHQKSINALLESLGNEISDFEKAVAYYYLGLNMKELNNIKEYNEYFGKAKNFGENTIVIELINKYAL